MADEWLKEGGEDVRKSTVMMLNNIQEEREVPKQWTEMLIKSIHKNKKDIHDFRNQKGLLITSVLSKVLEKIYYNSNINKIKNGNLNSNVDPRKDEAQLIISSSYKHY